MPGATSTSRHRPGHLDPATLLERVLDTMPGGIFTVDVAGRITSWNRAMEDLTGRPAAEAIGAPCAQLEGDSCFLGPLGLGQRRCPLFSGDSVRGKRCVIRHVDGRPLPILKHARLMHSGDGEVVGAIEAVTDLSEVSRLEHEVWQLRRESPRRAQRRMIGRHPTMQALYDMVEVAGRTPSSVLICGETGTGKELVAWAIHEASDRRDQPFVRVSCAALSETLLESELFGHVKGAFTGAVRDRKGRFEEAHQGTLFLDELGDISLDVQKKLLRVLQEQEFERVGDSRTVQVDIRLIGATNQDLVQACEAGRFRSDLYYRLAVIPIRVAPLRDRLSDIPLLSAWFVERFNRVLGRSVDGLDPAAMARLVTHDWPGNVRELEHAIEYAFAVARGTRITPEHLPPTMDEGPRRRPAAPGEELSAPRRAPGRPAPAVIEAALAETQGNKTQAARRLGVSRVTLWKWLKAIAASEPPGP